MVFNQVAGETDVSRGIARLRYQLPPSQAQPGPDVPAARVAVCDLPDPDQSFVHTHGNSNAEFVRKFPTGKWCCTDVNT